MTCKLRLGQSMAFGLVLCGALAGCQESVDHCKASNPDAPGDGAVSNDDGSPRIDVPYSAACDEFNMSLLSQYADCPALLLTGPCVEELALAETAPEPSGGTPTDGLYDLVAWTLYAGPGGTTGPTGYATRESMQFDGSKYHIANFVSASISGMTRWSDSVSFSGIQMDLRGRCPSTTAVTAYGYSANANTLKLFIPTSGAATVVTTYQLHQT